MPRTAGGSPKARNLGAELRKAREDADIAAIELARKLDITRARLQRWEVGTTVPTAEDVASYLAHVGTTRQHRERVVELARDVDNGNFITSDVPGLRTELTTLIEFERACTRILDVSPLLVPGLLQTTGYIRAVMSGIGVEDVHRRLGVRLERQGVLTQGRSKSRTQFTSYIAEGCLREPIGGCHVMAEQLRHIVNLAESYSNIEIRVIPSGLDFVHPASMGPFVLFEFPSAAPIVHLEHFRSAAFVHGTREVRAYEQAETGLRNAALSTADSVALMTRIATEMERT